jgi:predicted glycogen debranching enzyme
MKWQWDKAECQNLRTALRREWLETNGLGDYASSTLVHAHTRRYHGLLVAHLSSPPGRHVLLSSCDETLLADGREFPLACHKYPGVFFPRGHEYLERAEDLGWPAFHYRVGDARLRKEILLPHRQRRTLIRYTLEGVSRPLRLRLIPLLAFRSFHALTRANVDLQVKTFPAPHGFKIQPYNTLPPFFFQVQGRFEFWPAPDWYYNVEYLVELERGFPGHEDLFQPGLLETELHPGTPLIVSASIEPAPFPLDALWEAEAERRRAHGRVAARTPLEHLQAEGERFFIRNSAGQSEIVAGFPWFGSWGRDSLIALPGLAWCSGRVAEGDAVLSRLAEAERNGLIPNCLAEVPGLPHAYNSVDASLWFVWAVQQRQAIVGDEETIREKFWPVIRRIVAAYRAGTEHGIHPDEEGLLVAGHAGSQLTWMDATVDGVPVTPRHGAAVEINALWYNALRFHDELAERFGERHLARPEEAERLRDAFHRRFWCPETGCLGDTFRDGALDPAIRPNQIFAVSLPYPILDSARQPAVVETVRAHLLTPFGLRTLSPRHPAYLGRYAGTPRERDSAYHQGTVWPWLLGAYGDALFRVASDPQRAVRHLLDTIEPIWERHLLGEAGLGSVSEIFDGDPPHPPQGCIAQAWSVGELIRLLDRIRKTAPALFAARFRRRTGRT